MSSRLCQVTMYMQDSEASKEPSPLCTRPALPPRPESASCSQTSAAPPRSQADSAASVTHHGACATLPEPQDGSAVLLQPSAVAAALCQTPVALAALPQITTQEIPKTGNVDLSCSQAHPAAQPKPRAVFVFYSPTMHMPISHTSAIMSGLQATALFSVLQPTIFTEQQLWKWYQDRIHIEAVKRSKGASGSTQSKVSH